MRYPLVLIVLWFAVAMTACKSDRGPVPVQNEEAAIKIAIAAWEPVYGKGKIESEKPFHATLVGGVWTVSGTLPKGYVGGVAVAKIQKCDGKIVALYHEK